MTLGLLFWSQDWPVLVSDTIVLKATDQGTATDITPRNADFDVTDDLKLCRMVRKTMILDSGVILAFSGSEGNIRDYAKSAKREWERRPPEGRTVINACNTFTPESFTNYDIEGIMVAGELVDENRGSIRFGYTSNTAHSTEIPNRGNYIAIGSGAEFAIKYYERTSKQLVNPHIYEQFSPEQKFRLDTVQTSGAINNGQLFLNEAYGYRDDWGGYLETFVFDPMIPGWRTYASTLHLRCFLLGTAKKPVLAWADRFYFYSSEPGYSRLALHCAPDHRPGYCWAIDEVLNTTTSNQSLGADFWNKPFKPDYLMLTMSYWDEKMQIFDNRHMEVIGQSAKTFNATYGGRKPWNFRIEEETMAAKISEIVRDTGTNVFKPFPGVEDLLS